VCHRALVGQRSPVTEWRYADQHLEADVPLDPDYGADRTAKVLDQPVARAAARRLDHGQRSDRSALLEAAEGASLPAIGARSINAVRGLRRERVRRHVLRDTRCHATVVGDTRS
jgi:hypothetical protein